MCCRTERLRKKRFKTVLEFYNALHELNRTELGAELLTEPAHNSKPNP